MKLIYDSYAKALENFNYKERWEIFDNRKDSFNIAHECVDRHPKENTAIRIQFDNGRREVYTFDELSTLTSKFANMLEAQGINQGDRVAIILFPSLQFYVSFFGILKRGAVVVPCLPLFGPEAIEFRIKHSNAKMAIIDKNKVNLIKKGIVDKIVTSESLFEMIRGYSNEYKTNTSADSLAAIQFSSGTTGSPRPVYYTHIAATLTAVSIKFVIGLKDDDNYFCPSSPAWGHGIWYGTVGPLIFGRAIGTYSGKFNIEILLAALEEFEVTNITATPLIFRTMIKTGHIDKYQLKLRRMTYTGGPVDHDTLGEFEKRLGIVPQGFYGSTEVGVITANFAFDDFIFKPGSLGRAMFGTKVGIIDEDDNEVPVGEVGLIAVLRNNEWIRVGDLGCVDEDGYFWHKGRVDDVIISAGYTIGPIEIEEVLEKHPAVVKSAVVGTPDRERGEVVKAFIMTTETPSDSLKHEIQEFIKVHLSKHEYPREIEFVDSLPETPDGKIKRKELRFREYQKKGIEFLAG